ncbi:lipoprotein-releasing ABC transporter permease subunit [Ideonella paludis]|uniref:Lipoprotein-releasing ABC transporter permease subunit n=1 Tax=Ideonella paludis TaxID=1233411 RepID=A0ABS5DYV7_9BURK|nr:lipoprotein-releasing ABC transporter permease subunit [Ideonella paludis]MBQ0936330.1 lipoprotein-releasing ABC transporter permease subunit [Ideonella paludis]
MSFFSSLPFEWQIGWRYTRAGRAGRRNGFISFISLISVVGIALGVAALIIVLSVMNGFQTVVRDRMLAAIPHIEVYESSGTGLADWQALAREAQQEPLVKAAAPFVSSPSLLARGEAMPGVLVRGVLPEAEQHITDLAAKMKADGVLDQLQPGAWRIVIGVDLARALDVKVGETVNVITPGIQMTPAGGMPTMRKFTVAGIFNVGHFDYDNTLVMMHLDDAARLYRTGGPQGIQLRLSDVHEARATGFRLADMLGPKVIVRDWTRTKAQWYDAVQIEKRMMGIILTLIVAVAAFNLVSTLVMTVTDKRADIAILRTLGASPRSVMAIFVVQGATAGIIGTLSGVGLGLLVAFNVDVIVPFIERLLGVAFLPGNLYMVTQMPSDPQWADIGPITAISLILAFLATLYPSWRASRVNPAEALRYE